MTSPRQGAFEKRARNALEEQKGRIGNPGEDPAPFRICLWEFRKVVFSNRPFWCCQFYSCETEKVNLKAKNIRQMDEKEVRKGKHITLVNLLGRLIHLKFKKKVFNSYRRHHSVHQMVGAFGAGVLPQSQRGRLANFFFLLCFSNTRKSQKWLLWMSCNTLRAFW